MNFRSFNFHITVKFAGLLVFLLAGACAVQQPLTLTPFDDGEFWVLDTELVFTVRDSRQRIVVPRGFVTDFASVPRIFWSVFPRHGEYTRAAIVHDFLYWEQRCTRSQADELFDIIMQDSNVDSTTRLAIYAAVRVWGDSAWQANTEAKQQGYVRVIPARYLNFPIKTHWVQYREYLRKMIDDNDRLVEYPSKTPPAYCDALQEKAPPAEEAVPAPAPAIEEEPTPTPTPEPAPAPTLDFGIGA